MVNSNSSDNGNNSIANDLEQQTLILPDDVIFNNILSRLPVKSLIRFKSVCKLWHSTISSYNFAKSQLNISSASANQVILMNDSTPSLLFLPYDELNNMNPAEMIAVDISHFVKEHHRLGRWCVCDGLVLLRFHDFKKLKVHWFLVTKESCEEEITSNENDKKPLPPFGYFWIYNPATNQYFEIADPDSQGLQTDTFWFGYVPSINDYKILVRFFHKELHHYNYYVYTLRSQSWKMLPDLHSSDDLCHSSTVFGDLLHFSPTGSLPPQKIIGFNLVTEQVEEFPPMDWLSLYYKKDFFAMNGCLSLYCCYDDPFHPISDVWTLRQHDDWSSWEKSFSIYHGGLFSLLNVTPTPTGKFIIDKYIHELHSDQLEIILVSNNGQEQFHGNACILQANTIGGDDGGFYVESVIWPCGTIESTEEDHED